MGAKVPITTLSVRIDGRVQGVCYRYWTVSEATRRGLAGWVRNRSDGSVEALFHGPANLVEDMIQACHRGPLAARVDRIQTSTAQPPADGAFREWPTM